MIHRNFDEFKYLWINYTPLIFINGSYFKGNYYDIPHLLETFCNTFENPPYNCKNL